MKMKIILHRPKRKMRQKNKLCYENDIRIKVYNKEVILPDQRTIS